MKKNIKARLITYHIRSRYLHRKINGPNLKTAVESFIREHYKVDVPVRLTIVGKDIWIRWECYEALWYLEK